PRELPRPGALDPDHEPVGDAPRPALLSGAVPLRSRTLRAGGARGAPEVRLLPVRRRAARVHRRVVRLDGRDPRAGDDRRALQAAPGARRPRRAAAADHAPSALRHADDRRTERLKTTDVEP